MRSKDPIGYAAWGLPQGPAFACTLTILNKTKKQKLKKTQVLFGILISNKQFRARCENTKCFFYIRFPNKTCVFFSFCFFVLFSMVRVHAKAGPWGRPHAAYPIGPFERTFFTLQKKPLLRDFTYLGLKQARPKTLPKKV